MPSANGGKSSTSSPGSKMAARGNPNSQGVRSSGMAPLNPSTCNGSLRNSTARSPAPSVPHGQAATGQLTPIPRCVQTVAFDHWTRDLDQELRDFCKDGREGERKAIASISSRYPHLSPTVIWSRIVYLGLTTSKRRPHFRPEWTAEDIELLAAGYCDGRSGATHAINALLRMHPDWTRSKISWKAKSLGFSHGRPNGYQRWSEDGDRRLISCEGLLMESVEKRLKRSPKSILSRLAALDRGMEFYGADRHWEIRRARAGRGFVVSGTPDIRTLLLDPVDLRGLPFLGEGGRAEWATPCFLPTSGAGVVFLDELNAAPAMVQAACYQLVLDRRLGEYSLPDEWSIIAAGNRDSDRAVTARLRRFETGSYISTSKWTRRNGRNGRSRPPSGRKSSRSFDSGLRC